MTDEQRERKKAYMREWYAKNRERQIAAVGAWPSGKATWLYVSGVKREDLPMLTWGKTEQRLPEWMIERYGYEKARRIGVVAMVGGKNKTAIRNATPEPFRDLLLSIARQAHNAEVTGRPHAHCPA